MAKGVDIGLVKACLRYEDGRLFWESRPSEHFASNSAWSSWNTRFTGKEAGGIDASNPPRFKLFLGGTSFYRYQAVWAIHHGEWLDRIDHKDNDCLND